MIFKGVGAGYLVRCLLGRSVLCVVLLYLLTPAVFAADVYKYKDENGRWHFSDKKPKTKHETVSLKRAKSVEKPYLGYAQEGDERLVMASNPWFAPAFFRITRGGVAVTELLVPAQTDMPVVLDGEGAGASSALVWTKDMEYTYRMGDPDAQFDNQPLAPPIPKLGRFRITQGFNGLFSHTEPNSAYAIDIAMNVGDAIHAARGGVVVWVKDDYHMGGRDDFFMDKANVVRILHDDGSFGVYAHILLGSAKVQPGAVVQAGDLLAQAGSSGYSTGPHLHFVVQVSNGRGWVSVPFRFAHSGQASTPQAKQWLRRQ